MASEPAEPTTRPQDDVIEKAAWALDLLAEHTFSYTTDPQNAGCDSDEEPCTCGIPVSDWTCHHVDVLAKAGLLADPAQTTELEELRAKVEQLLPLIEEREEWRRGMHADMAEISRLSLLLRGMARKLHRLRRELAETTGFAGQQSNARREADRERDERQARIDAALVVLDGGVEFALMPGALHAVRAALVGDQPARPGLTHAVAWLNRKVEQIEAEGDIDHDPRTKGQHYAYVQAHAAIALAVTHPERWMNEVWPRLVGDQPPAEEPKRRCCIGPFADGSHAPGCLDACQDCGGNVAEPRRCRCRDAPRAVEESDACLAGYTPSSDEVINGD